MKKVLIMLACAAAPYAQARDLAITLSSGMNELLTTVAAEVDIGGGNDLSVGIGLGGKTMEGKIGLIKTMSLAKNLFGKARLNFGGGRYNPRNNSEFTYAVGEASLGMKTLLYEGIYVEVGALQRAVVNKDYDRTPSAYLSASINF